MSETEKNKPVRIGPSKIHIPKRWGFDSISSFAEDIIYPQRDKPKRFDGDIPWVRIEDLDGVYVSDSSDERYVSKRIIDEMNLRSFPKGTVMCSVSTSMGVCAITERELLSNQTFAGIVPNPSMDEHYLYYSLRNLSEELQSIATGTTIDYLPRKRLEGFQIPTPPVSEQRRVASVLYQVDQHIDTLDRRHTRLRELKHALMQDLFTGTRRLSDGEHSNMDWVEDPTKGVDRASVPNLPTDWKSARLESITEGSLYGINESGVASDGENMVEYIRVTNLGELISGLDGEVKYVQREDVGDKQLGPGDILFARSGSVGKTHLIREQSEKTYGGYMIRYRVNKDRVSPEYLLQYTKSPLYWDWIHRIARGGVQKNISTKEYDDLLIPLPPMEEQQMIANTLFTIDDTVKKTDELKHEYKELKRGLMQDLLTGDVRTPEDLAVLPEIQDTLNEGETV